MAGALQGKKGLVVGVANDKSIAWGCARALRDAGAELALTWFNDKARPHVEPLAQQLQAPIPLPLDVEQAGQMEAVFAAIAQRWGQLDFVLHSIAFARSRNAASAWSSCRWCARSRRDSIWHKHCGFEPSSRVDASMSSTRTRAKPERSAARRRC